MNRWRIRERRVFRSALDQDVPMAGSDGLVPMAAIAGMRGKCAVGQRSVVHGAYEYQHFRIVLRADREPRVAITWLKRHFADTRSQPSCRSVHRHDVGSALHVMVHK